MDPPRQRRNYSKGGCRECKRRKIKCDETKPACLRCLRMAKECSYPVPGETVLRMSTRELQQMGLYKQTLSIRHYKPPTESASAEDVTMTQSTTPPPCSSLSSTPTSITTSSEFPSASLSRILNHPAPFNTLDVSSIADGLAQLADLMGSRLPTLSVSISQVQPVPSDITTVNVNSDYVKLPPEESSYYYEAYSTFCPCLLPLPRWNGHSYSNPVRDTIVTFSGAYPIVLAATLAVGSKLKGKEDLSANYLATVSSLAKSQLESIQSMRDLESLIVASVFLASAATHLYPSEINWQNSLTSVARFVSKSSTVEQSKVSVLCKWLLFTFDATSAQPPLSGALSVIGASCCPKEKAVLEEWGLLLTSGFNLLTGTSQAVIHLHEGFLDFFVKGTNRIDYRKGLTLMSGYANELNHLFCPSPQDVGFVESPWGSTVNGSFVSWMDISHQTHTHAFIAWSLVTIYGVAWTSPQVQQILSQIIQLVDNINTAVESSLGPLVRAPIAMRWPVLVACSFIKDLELRSRGHEYLNCCKQLSTLKEDG
ncbi:hypothetical protein DIRU0_E42252 [Diutina rugosa]